MASYDSYRTSHQGRNFGVRYESMLASKMDAAIWDEFGKPHLCGLLQREAAAGRNAYLDFACGTGRITQIGAEFFDHCTAVDISPDMLEFARERVPSARFHCLDVTTQPDGVEGLFDCVTAFRFFANAEPALRDEVAAWISAHMSRGGVLIGNTHSHPWSVLGALNLLSTKVMRRTRRTLSRREMEALLSRHGLTIRRWDGFRVFPTVAGRAPLGNKLQTRLEKVAAALPLGFFGADQYFVAVKD